jgi:hypothetical protein
MGSESSAQLGPVGRCQRKNENMPAKIYLIAAALVLITATGAPLIGQTSAPNRQRGRLVPFHGMISAVDRNAKTVTISGKKQPRVFKITDKTVITKSGAPATIEDITENQEASGSYVKTAEGELEARTLRIGALRSRATPSPTAASKGSQPEAAR